MASIDDVTVGEGAATMTLTLELTRRSDEDVTYKTLGDGSEVSGTATATDDYADFLQGSDVEFTVPAGELSATFGIAIVDDAVDEADETIVIVWQRGNGTNATPTSLTFTGTITDDDTAGVTVSKSTLAVTEQDTTGDIGAGLGWRLEGAPLGDFAFRLEAARLDTADDDAEHRIGLTVTARW